MAARIPLARALPMEARSMDELPAGTGWWFEPKWDGFRCLARKSGAKITLTAKSGKPLDRYFPDVMGQLERIKASGFTLDGELLIKDGKARSFEQLQARLHPARSRIARLSVETPALLMAFDMLQTGGRDLRALALSERRRSLEAFIGRASGEMMLSPGTDDRRVAARWLRGGRYEGVIAKRLDEPYLAGERAMVKVKRRRTADCVVGGFRYETRGTRVGSLLLGLYNDAGKLDHVGFTSGFAHVDRTDLTMKLEALRGGKGFSGAAPGGPSRWATERSSEWTPVKPKLVVEVSFDHVSNGRFRHGMRLLRFRPDKTPTQCRMDQIA